MKSSTFVELDRQVGMLPALVNAADTDPVWRTSVTRGRTAEIHPPRVALSSFIQTLHFM
jgi:hypothetical protein